ncbi:MAG: hypothetical protein IKA75_01450 [Bacteroidaceae bacterium]|nr:hypothetical protein [Bacteroidaceae bacterium]MBR3759043.1 hypothetical protein [Bacteroidaceae bacterium]
MKKALLALRDIRKKVFTEAPASKKAVRQGWSAAARKAHEAGNDQLMDG